MSWHFFVSVIIIICCCYSSVLLFFDMTSSVLYFLFCLIFVMLYWERRVYVKQFLYLHHVGERSVCSLPSSSPTCGLHWVFCCCMSWHLLHDFNIQFSARGVGEVLGPLNLLTLAAEAYILIAVVSQIGILQVRVLHPITAVLLSIHQRHGRTAKTAAGILHQIVLSALSVKY